MAAIRTVSESESVLTDAREVLAFVRRLRAELLDIKEAAREKRAEIEQASLRMENIIEAEENDLDRPLINGQDDED